MPGSTIYNLILNKKLPEDLLSCKNADKVLKYENKDWNYQKKFIVDKKESFATLVYERLDTYVDVYFNDVFLGHRENGNLEHRFDVSDLVIVGENIVELKFKSCITTAKPVADDVPYAFTGVKIFCKGGNWVPSQPYLMQNKEEKIVETLRVAKEMGVNMIRIWGGECKTFYDECSRLGILLTQDFLMDCGLYPEKEDWFIEELLKESEYAVKLIRNQPCLAWWSGDNENAVEGSDVQNDYRLRDSYCKGIDRYLLNMTRIVKRLLQVRTVVIFTPQIKYGRNYAQFTIFKQMFNYIVENDSLDDYKEKLKMNRARFVVEEPVFGAVSYSTLKKFMSEDDVFSDNLSMWLYHTKSNPELAVELMDYFYIYDEKILGKYIDTKDRFFKYKYIQYEWIRVIMEQARREKWFCSGIIFWMLNECWTAAAGWSMIDYYNKIKIGGYSFKRCAKPIILSIDNVDNKFNLSLINDGVDSANCNVSILKISKTKTETIKELKIYSPANEKVVLPIDASLNSNEILIAEMCSDINNDRAFYKFGNLNILPANNDVTYEIDKTNRTLILKAQSYVHVVDIDGDAIFSDNGFLMLKGESKIINYDNGDA